MKQIFLVLICLSFMGCVTTDSDVLSGNWKFGNTLDQNLKPWGFKIVRKSDNYPVRNGMTSMRFEVRSGDCSWSSGKATGSYYSDCDNHAERRELKQRPQSEGGSGNERGENWYHYSLYLPSDFPMMLLSKVTLAQFHDGNKIPISNLSFMFTLNKYGKYEVENTFGGSTGKDVLLDIKDMKSNWTDILVHANWVANSSGFFRIYVNGNIEPSYVWSGSTKRDVDNVHFKFGIYRRGVIKIKNSPIPTQIVYYDDVRKGKTCSEVTEYFDCDKITSGIHGS